MNHETPSILLHPGGGGAQYPFRFKPFRPRNIWRRTPGPRPPDAGSNGLRTLIGLMIVVIVAVTIAVSVSTGFFGLTGSEDPEDEYFEATVEVGFQIESNIIHRNIRTLNGEFQGIRAVVAIPRNNEDLTTGYLEVQEAARWLNAGTNWDGLSVKRAIVLCEPVQQCDDLALLLNTAMARTLPTD